MQLAELVEITEYMVLERGETVIKLAVLLLLQVKLFEVLMLKLAVDPEHILLDGEAVMTGAPDLTRPGTQLDAVPVRLKEFKVPLPFPV